MKLQVRLRGGLERYAGNYQGYQEITLPDGSAVSQLMELYPFAKGEVGLIVLNGELVAPDTGLSEGAQVELYPVFGGG